MTGLLFANSFPELQEKLDDFCLLKARSHRESMEHISQRLSIETFPPGEKPDFHVVDGQYWPWVMSIYV